MSSPVQPKGKYQVIFAAMALLLICSLGAGIFGTIVIDAFSDDDNPSSSANIDVDTSIEEAFRATAEAAPESATAAAALANYLAYTGKLPEAITWYEKAVQIAPDDPVIRLDFARSLASGEFTGDAQLQFERAIELNPNDPQAYFYFGELFFNADPQRTVEAIDQYEKTIELGGDEFVAERARERLAELGVASPVASPVN